jgi:predicted transcriptional regulator
MAWFSWHLIKKRAVRKLKKAGAVTKPGIKPEKIMSSENLAWDERKALEKFLGKEGIRKTQDGYYLECEDGKHC